MIYVLLILMILLLLLHQINMILIHRQQPQLLQTSSLPSHPLLLKALLPTLGRHGVDLFLVNLHLQLPDVLVELLALDVGVDLGVPRKQVGDLEIRILRNLMRAILAPHYELVGMPR